MRSLCYLTCAMLSGYTQASGGGSAGAIFKNTVYSTAEVAHARYNETTVLLGEAEAPIMSLDIWLKANDADRLVQEMHGNLKLAIDPPSTDRNVKFGFFFGQQILQKKGEPTLAP